MKNNISIKIIDSIGDIQKKVNKAIAEEVNKVLSQRKSTILQQAQSLVVGWISSQPEMQDLQSPTVGSLAGQFGLYAGQGQGAVIAVTNAIKSATTIEFKKFNQNLVGGFDINFQPTDFLNLLSLPQGIVNYENGALAWLDWLLTKGDTTIVVNYHYNAQTGIGRSGLGNMVKGGSFRVPPEFSGTEKNNFITRALIGEDQEKALTDIFKRELGG